MNNQSLFINLFNQSLCISNSWKLLCISNSWRFLCISNSWKSLCISNSWSLKYIFSLSLPTFILTPDPLRKQVNLTECYLRIGWMIMIMIRITPPPPIRISTPPRYESVSLTLCHTNPYQHPCLIIIRIAHPCLIMIRINAIVWSWYVSVPLPDTNPYQYRYPIRIRIRNLSIQDSYPYH